jgi:RecB family exonuclease
MAEIDFTLPDAAWSGGHLLLADEAAIDKVRRKWFSASVASKTLQCPASMAASRLLGQIDDPFGARELGTARHAVMEDFYTLPAENRTLEAMDKIIDAHAALEWSLDKLDRQDKDSVKVNGELRQRWIDEVTRGSRAIFSVEDPTKVKVHANEQKIFTHLGKGPGRPDGVPSILKIDRVVVGDDGGLEVDDFKFKDGDETAAKKALSKPDTRYGDDYGDQQRLYVLGIEAETGIRPKRASLIYPFFAGKYRPAMNGVRHIDLSEQEIQKTVTRYAQAWDLMNASADRQMFETRPGALCAWCPLANSCPVAQVGISRARDPIQRQAAVDKQLAAAAGQPSALQLGIPILRPGAAPAEARTGIATGVSVPRAPVTIAPVGDDLFPVTTGEPDAPSAAFEQPVASPDSHNPATELSAPPVQPEVPVEPRHAVPAFPGALEGPAHLQKADDELGSDPFDGAPWPEEPPGSEYAADDAIPAGLPGAQDAAAPRMWEALAHESIESHPNAKAGPMTQNMQIRPEGPVYDEQVSGALNLNSYAAIAATGLVTAAYEHLAANGQVVNPTTMNRLTDVLAGIVLRAQYEATGQMNFQRGAQTRLRGLLHARLAHKPAPFGQTAAAWEAWIAQTQRFLTVGLTEAMALYDRTPVQNDSHLYFASDVAAN